MDVAVYSLNPHTSWSWLCVASWPTWVDVTEDTFMIVTMITSFSITANVTQPRTGEGLPLQRSSVQVGLDYGRPPLLVRAGIKFRRSTHKQLSKN